MNYATINDVILLYRKLSADEQEKANALIPVVCASLRAEAAKCGKDLDALVAQDDDVAAVAKSVVADVIGRTLMTPTDSVPMSQMSQSALGYTVSGTYLNPGGGLFIKKSELARLGLRRQRFGGVDIYG